MGQDTISITDPVHSAISVSRDEVAIIDTPIFQRLRRIKQLGNVHLVFPGAVHTRFSHGLGVMHMAGRSFDALLGDSDQHSAACRELRRVIRLAGLLHDVGHGPLSHLFETALLRKISDGGVVAAQLGDLEAPGMHYPDEWLRTESRAQPHDLTHEHYTAALIYALSSRVPTFTVEIAQSVCCLLEERFVAPPWLLEQIGALAAQLDLKAPPDTILSCLRELLSGEIDADKLDYLRRDSYGCGITIGHLDADYLLKSLRLGSDKRSCYFLVPPSAIQAFEQVLTARKQMFDRVYSHRVNTAFDWLLERILEDRLIRCCDGLFPPYSLAQFLRMTDDWLEDQIRCLADSDEATEPEWVRRYAQMFTTRTMLTRQSDAEQLCERSDEKRMSTLLARAYPPPGHRVVSSKLKELTKVDREGRDDHRATVTYRVSGYDPPMLLSERSELLRSTLWRRRQVRLFVFRDDDADPARQELTSKLQFFTPGPATPAPATPAPATPSSAPADIA